VSLLRDPDVVVDARHLIATHACPHRIARGIAFIACGTALSFRGVMV
jgi:hypothetical protein